MIRGILRTTRAASPSWLLVTLLALVSSTDAAAEMKACGADINPIEINQATLYYFECGEGEPLVFVHGGLGDLHTFRPQLQTFAEHFRVIAYSRRYHPPNALPGAADTTAMAPHVADLVALVKALKATPAHFVAHSGGAYVVLAMALNHPELARSLVLGEPPVWSLLSRTSVGEALKESWIRRVIAPSAEAFKNGDLEAGVRQFMEGICVRPGCFDASPEAGRTELIKTQGPMLGLEMLAMMTDMARAMPTLACEALAKLKLPKLLVTGERSPAGLLLITAELEYCMEGESHVMVPDAGHGMHSANPTFYNGAVLAFLQRARGSAR
jgi:pimeloyl-ACP methyl ester carboxylesterase